MDRYQLYLNAENTDSSLSDELEIPYLGNLFLMLRGGELGKLQVTVVRGENFFSQPF